MEQYSYYSEYSQENDYEQAETIVQKTEYTYDPSGRLLQQTEYFPVSGVLTKNYTQCFTYDAFGRLASASDYRGNTAPSDPQITYEYDSMDRISKVSYEVPGSDIDYVRYIYDSNGWLSQIKVKEGLLEKTLREYTYDSFGRVSSTEDKYDPGSLGGALTRSYSYDALGNVTQTSFAKGQDQTEQYGYTYDTNGNITAETSSITYPAGGNDHVLQKSLSYSYDAAGRLTAATGSRQDGGASSSISRQYQYDAAGNRISETDGNVTTEYTYNELNQMTAAVSRQGENTLSSVTCAYDANGNQISETDSILGTNTTYTYDPAGQLTQAVKSENNVQTLLQENRYDGEGQRIQKTVHAQSPGNITQTTRNYHYQNGEVLYTDDGSVTDAFQMLGAAENVISTIRPEGSGYAWYLYSDDIRGSISSLTDESGDIAAAYEYDEFGEIEALTGANFDNELCYTGQIRDKETGLYYCNARYYDPTIGRFLTQDTYRGEQTVPQTMHLYAYCANDPVNHLDPNGHTSLGLGFWNKEYKYFAWYQNAPQKVFGYYDIYDLAADYCGMKLRNYLFETKKWKIEFWKGQYGEMLNHSISSGCEIGLYYKSNNLWKCAYQKKRRLRMKMSLYKIGYGKLFTRDSKTTTKQGKACWLTAFQPFGCMPERETAPPGKLRMKGKIWFGSNQYSKQMRALSKKMTSGNGRGKGAFQAEQKGSWKKVSFTWR